jgi:CBS domain-containing protein
VTVLPDRLVSAYMTTALEVAFLDTSSREVSRRLAARRISALPVVDDDGALAGVVSRVDLLHHPRRVPGADVSCARVMSREPVTIAPTASLRDAAHRMLQHRIHRVFVVDGARLCGVLTTTDLTRAVGDSGLARTLAAIMSAPVATVGVDLPLAAAIERLERDHVSGLIVTENDWPVGVFAQEDALGARHLPAATEVGTVYDPSLVCLPRETPIPRAASLAARMGVRRIVVSHQRDFVGIVTGLDFAGAIAEGALQVAS